MNISDRIIVMEVIRMTLYIIVKMKFINMRITISVNAMKRLVRQNNFGYILKKVIVYIPF